MVTVFDACPNCQMVRTVKSGGGVIFSMGCESGCVPIHYGGPKEGEVVVFPLDCGNGGFYTYRRVSRFRRLRNRLRSSWVVRWCRERLTLTGVSR